MLRALMMLAILATALPASAGQRDIDHNLELLEASQAIRFRNADGGTFDPDRIEIVTSSGTLAADFPGAPLAVRNEDRVDLSEVPVLGQLFRSGLSTGDAAAKGERVGAVYRNGATLIVDARDHVGEVTALPVTLTTNLARYGAVSFELGYLSYGAGAARPAGEPIGAAFLVDGRLVLASNGGEPAWPSFEAFLDDLF